MIDSSPAVAVVYAKQLDLLREFYCAVAELDRGPSAPGGAELTSAVFTLELVEIPGHIARGITITRPPERRTETPIKLVFPVGSIATSRSLAERYGGCVDPVAAEWEHNQFRVCDGHDPEGNVFQLREAARS